MTPIPIQKPRWWWCPFTRAWRAWHQYQKALRRALPDGTRVRLLCDHANHRGVYTTSWSPRRMGLIDDPDDYRLTRVSDGATTFAEREAFEVLE